MPKEQDLFYNIFFENREGDKILVAQTSEPESFVGMEYPAFNLDAENETEIIWNVEIGDDSMIVRAVPVRNIKLNVLFPETEYNKVIRAI